MRAYRAAVIGCSRIGGFIDNEVAHWMAPELPYSHAAGYEAVDRTELVACADLNSEVMARFGERYHIPPERQYTDYREMIKAENLDIVSIATQPEPRGDMVVFACENGVKALYCEKPLCASLDEANRIVEAVERHSVVFNMGTNRRWSPAFDALKELVQSGSLGSPQAIISYANNNVFNRGSHTFDLAMWLLKDEIPIEVQAYLPKGDDDLDGDIIRTDPRAEAMVRFGSGVTMYAMLCNRYREFEVICDEGCVTGYTNGEWKVLRKKKDPRPDEREPLVEIPFPRYTPSSSTKRIIEDIVHALDTGEATRGGVQVAHRNMQVILACVESHRRGGARVSLPLTNSPLKLARAPKARKPIFQPTDSTAKAKDGLGVPREA